MPCYSIAGVCVSMDPTYSLTKQRALPYRIDDMQADIVLESGYTDAYEEYAELAKQFYAALLAFDGFLLHSSAVELDGKAYMFSAPSGTGKSTHAAHWRRLFGATTINDDKPAVRVINGTFYACGTPFCGKCDLSTPVTVPLGGIAVLRRGTDTRVRRLHGAQALWPLLDQILRPETKAGMDRLLTLVGQLLEAVPVYEIVCTKEEESAEIVRRAVTCDE